MRNYELTIVLDGKATSAKKKSMAGKIEKLVKDLKGKIVKNDDWGKKDLAYKLGKSDTGVYLFFELELEPVNLKSLSDKVKAKNDILRFLLVKK